MAITRRFQIEVLKDRQVTEHRYSFVIDPETKVSRRDMQEVKRIVPESYMVYFVGGHSIWVETKAQLAALHLLPSDNTEIDTETGLPHAPPQLQNLKAVVERKTASTENALG